MMDVQVYPDYSSLSTAAASMIINTVKENPEALLCFATGDTPTRTYQLVIEMAGKEHIYFSTCFMIGLDEWLGIPPNNSGSCYYFLHQNLFDPLSIHPSQIYLFDSLTTDETAACEQMNAIIKKKGGIDFMVAGVGMNGHIGFNEPGSDINSMAHVVWLDETTRTVGKKYFREEVDISKGITMGLKQVMEAKTLLVIANGKKKAPVIKKALEEEMSTGFPASIIQRHPNAVLMIDREAASELEISANGKSIDQRG